MARRAEPPPHLSGFTWIGVEGGWPDVPYPEYPHQYALGSRLVPESCEADVAALLAEVRRRTHDLGDDEEAFDAAQNAEVAAVTEHLGPRSKGLAWEHNTHVGDARATDMARVGLVDVGQLLRERHTAEGVALVGFASHRGSVIAAAAWGAPERVFPVPDARPGSHEDLLHRGLGEPAVLVFGGDRSGPGSPSSRTMPCLHSTTKPAPASPSSRPSPPASDTAPRSLGGMHVAVA